EAPPRDRRSRARQHHDPDRDGARPRDRRRDRLLGGDRDHLRLARHGPADHRLHHRARPARDRRLPNDDGVPGDPDQSAGRYPLFRARSARASGRERGDGMTAVIEERRAKAGLDETPLRRLLAEFFASGLALAGLIALAVILVVAVFAPWLSPQNPYDLAA